MIIVSPELDFLMEMESIGNFAEVSGAKLLLGDRNMSFVDFKEAQSSRVMVCI